MLSFEGTYSRALLELVRKQARKDPVCAEMLALDASLSWEGRGASFIPTMLDNDDELLDMRPF